MSAAQQLEYYYQALGYQRLWFRFRDLSLRPDFTQSRKAYDQALFYYKLYKYAVLRAGI